MWPSPVLLLFIVVGFIIVMCEDQQDQSCPATKNKKKQFAFDTEKKWFKGQISLNNHGVQTALVDSGASITKVSKFSALMAKVKCCARLFFSIESIFDSQSL